MELDQTVLLPYRLRTVRVGLQATLLVSIALAFFAALPGHAEPVPTAGLIGIIAVALAGAVVIHRAPWSEMLDKRLGMRMMLAWSVLDIMLVSLGVAITGGAHSDLFIGYALTTVFFSASYPRRGHFFIVAFTVANYLVVLAATDWGIGASTLFIRVSVLGILTYIAGFLSSELQDQMSAHAESRRDSDQRSALLAVVAAAGRSMSSLDPDRVLEVVADSVVALEFDACCIWMLEEHDDDLSLAHFRGIEAQAGARIPRDVGTVGRAVQTGQTVVIDDYASWDGAVESAKDRFAGMVAAPVYCDGVLAGVLHAGTIVQRPISETEVECLELLAGHAGAALANARHFVERQAYEAVITHQAFHDSLTGLPNRALFADRLAHARAKARRSNEQIGVLFIDVDRFKTVNDSLGHDVGDLLLVAVAARLTETLRPEDTLARYAGDEFTILLERVTESGAQRVADRVLKAFEQPFRLAGRSMFVTASIGVAVESCADASRAGADLLREADLAMYRAKERGRARWELYEPSLNARAVERLDAVTELRRALERDEFSVVYQPIVALADRRIVGVEALVRWSHPERGVVGPDDFIALAEETGLIVPLGAWVLEEACRQAEAWSALGLDLGVSVNLSAVQFAQEELVAQVVGVLDRTGLDPARLTLEVTESVVIRDLDQTIGVMQRLAALGVELALDDFGEGTTSLSSLRRLPLTTVKIDKSFVDGLTDQGADHAIVRSVLDIARALGLRVVAEGVERMDQFRLLGSLGCDAAQGYLMCPPADPADVPAIAADGLVRLGA